MAPPNHIQITIPSDNAEAVFDYSKRAEWHRAALLGANDGFVSVASLMMRVGSFRDEGKALFLTFFAGYLLVLAAWLLGNLFLCWTLIEKRRNNEDVVEERLFNRFQAMLASALVLSLGAFAP